MPTMVVMPTTIPVRTVPTEGTMAMMTVAMMTMAIGDLMEKIGLGVGCVAGGRECEGWPEA